MRKRNPTERFSDRVTDYVASRPGYPAQMMDFFVRELGLSADSRVADIGCGTGISSKYFLESGCEVHGVEPNDEMRVAAVEFLRDFSRFRAFDGTAEATGLESGIYDFVAAAQSFHWFDQIRAAREFRRIGKKSARFALIWNQRELEVNDFHRGYENLLREFATDYQTVRHDLISLDAFESEFGRKFAFVEFPNAQTLDLDGLRSRICSSSYTPARGDERFQPMIDELKRLFAKYSESGKIQVSYTTKIYYL